MTALDAGAEHVLALKGDGTVVAWGNNGSGQATVPTGLTGVTAIAAGDFHSLAPKSDGTVVAWGANGDGQANVPSGLAGGIAVAGGAAHSLAVVIPDATPPDLTVSVNPSVLWPPNHKHVTVQATVTATDAVDPNPTITLVSVTSNEPDNGGGDGNTVNDIVVKPAALHTYADTFQLRAERSGTGSGRVYTIIYTAADASGNTSAPQSATVTVPH